jgi:hypothetical protein
MSSLVRSSSLSCCELLPNAFRKTFHGRLETQSLMDVDVASLSIRVIKSWWLPLYSSKPSTKKQNLADDREILDSSLNVSKSSS